MKETQAELVEWEHISPRCSVLKLREWEADTAGQGDGKQGAEVEGRTETKRNVWHGRSSARSRK